MLISVSAYQTAPTRSRVLQEGVMRRTLRKFDLATFRSRPRRAVFAVFAVLLVLSAIAAASLWVVSDDGDGRPADASMTAAVTPLTAARCATPTAADCILAVYQGAPDDYRQVQDIPSELLLAPDVNGRYQVERGQQYTVVSAAQLPADWTRFYLERTPDQAQISPTTLMQLVPPVGTTYTFTITSDERGANLLSFDLHAARPLPIQRPGIKPELGDVVVNTEFLVPALRYNTIDSTGTASSAGSYSFLKTAGTTSSAEASVYRYARQFQELRLNPSDALGVSRSTFYDTIAVGDKVDFRTNGLDCAYRYAVTSSSASGTGRSFGIHYIFGFGLRCGADIGEVHFVWKVPAGVPASDGLQLLLDNEPTGPGTYLLTPGYPWVIDVPVGSTIMYGGFYEGEHIDEPGDSTSGVVIIDAKTGAVLHIDPVTGLESVRRGATTAESNALFDDIIASIRPSE